MDNNDQHVWGEFLRVRMKCIKWMRTEMKRSDEQIAEDLSMDATQVFLIRTGGLNAQFFNDSHV